MGVAMIAAAAGGGAVAPSAGARKTPVKPTQQLAALLSSHKVVSTPGPCPSQVGKVRASRPITGGQTVLPVVDRKTTKGGVRWLQVLIPGRPNGGKGWIAQKKTELLTTSWHLVVRRSKRQVLVYSKGRLVKSFSAIVASHRRPPRAGGSS